MRATISLTLFLVVAAAHHTAAADPMPLELEKKIPLGKVSGRIDHFAIDPKGHRLFLAELGNNTVSAIDIKTGTVVQRLTGLREPQGVGFAPEDDVLYVANAGDGSVQTFRGSEPLAKLDLKDDADNVRIDSTTQDVVVGFGSGALAVIDAKTLAKKAEIKLKGHPESFQIDSIRRRAYVNVPDAHEIAVVDLAKGQQVAAWNKLPASSNFPMALIANGERVAVAFRSPARLIVFDASNGSVVNQMPTCGDADDVFFDPRRDRLYVSCGEGKIDVFEKATSAPHLIAQVPTSLGARTAFFDATDDRLYLAVRAVLTRPAEVWVYRATE